MLARRMHRASLPGIAVMLAACVSAGWGALEQVDEHTWRDDFEGNTLDGWNLPEYYRLTTIDGNGVLEVGGPEQEQYSAVKLAYEGVGRELSDYAVECRVRHLRGSWAGLFFRKCSAGWLEAFIFGSRILVRRQPGSVVLSLAPLPDSDEAWRTLRIVGTGPFIRVYVDGRQIFSCGDEELVAGRCGISSHHTHAYYDDFVIAERLQPHETLIVRPDAPEDGLLVPPGEPTTIQLDAWNAGDEPREVELAWRMDEGETSRTPVTLGPRERRLVPIEQQALAEGLHWIEVSFREGGEEVAGGSYPIAAVAPPDVEADEPFLAWGVYDKYQLGGEPWALNTYLHAMCNDLRNHGFNTIMAGNAMPRPTVRQLDILSRYGMKVILRGIGELPREVTTHPAVLAIAYGDEPKVEELEGYRARFEELAEEYAAPITTCLIGDAVGTRGSADPWLIWPELGSAFKLARYYPIRKSVYDLVRFPNYKGGLSPQAIFRLLEIGAGEDGWYYVIQAFGDHVSEEMPEPYWRNPTAAEMRGMAHLALAHGARGVIAYTYQTERERWPALVDQRWLRPNDGKYEALAEVARQVAPVREVLLDSHWEALEVRATPATVWPVPRMTSDGRRLAYVVNLDTDARADARIEIIDPVVNSRRVPLAWVRELFGGAEIGFERAEMRSTFGLRLGPGRAALLEFATDEQ